jgi:hypothetical protein
VLFAAMLTAQIGAEANNINQALDRLKTTRRRRTRRQLMTHALLASQRALEELSNEPLVVRTASYVAETMERYGSNALAVAEELRMDKATIRWFVKAECQLLLAEGFDPEVVTAIEEDMLAALADPLNEAPESLEGRFRELSARIEEDLGRLEREGERADMYRHIATVLGVLGGCAVVAANTGAAAGTAGTAAALLAVSIPIGSEMLSRSLSEAGDD